MMSSWNVFFSILFFAVASESFKVAVIGTTGNVGRSVIKQLSKQGIPTRCLLRHDISNVPILDKPSTSVEVAASLAALDNVKMVKGDVTDLASIQVLIEGCDVIMALHGPRKPNMLSSLFPIFSDQNSPSHPYMTNYVGMQNIIEAAKASSSVKRIVRLSGKGEQPFSFISILLNMLGNLAKAWNYEGEALLRQSGLDYTIIRPGLMKKSSEYTEPPKARGLVDNGQDMKVSIVTCDQIAELCVDCIKYDNAKKSTLTAMNTEENTGEDSYEGLLQKVQADSRYFEPSLIKQHRMGTRLGFTVLTLFFGGFCGALSKSFSFLLQ